MLIAAVLIWLSRYKIVSSMLLARLAFISCLLFRSLALSVNLGFLLEFMGKYPLRSVLVITNTKSGELSFSRSSRTFYNTFGHQVTWCSRQAATFSNHIPVELPLSSQRDS